MGLPLDFSPDLGSRWPKGQRNLISDVDRVKVGHVTLSEGAARTGVTAVLPHDGNMFRDKLMAGAAVLNGFGKTTGLPQIEELGTIETPIILTNTLSVGTAFTGLAQYMMEQNPEIGRTAGTVNCVVGECNDGHINDIRGLFVREHHVKEAIEAAGKDFDEGAVGAGTGMRSFGMKGGIGSSSRIVRADGEDYTVGALTLVNFGAAGRLRVGGIVIDNEGKSSPADGPGTGVSRDTAGTPLAVSEKGSIIIIIATDLPLSSRELTRLARRAAPALGRTGSYMGHGSGDIAIAFSTANHVRTDEETSIVTYRMLADEALDPVFEATVEAVEESVISALYHAETVSGREGDTVHSLREYL